MRFVSVAAGWILKWDVWTSPTKPHQCTAAVWEAEWLEAVGMLISCNYCWKSKCMVFIRDGKLLLKAVRILSLFKYYLSGQMKFWACEFFLKIWLVIVLLLMHAVHCVFSFVMEKACLRQGDCFVIENLCLRQLKFWAGANTSTIDKLDWWWRTQKVTNTTTKKCCANRLCFSCVAVNNYF